jgi:hypothetical protein
MMVVDDVDAVEHRIEVGRGDAPSAHLGREGFELDGVLAYPVDGELLVVGRRSLGRRRARLGT